MKKLFKYFPFLILLVVLISYGQLLLMFPWQDDHTIFFKLAHLADKAGYFGYGPIGEGSYKYIITPYVPIYKLFGFNIVVYYAFGILFYFLASLGIYKVFAKILDEASGRVAGFLFAAGFIASDGIIRIFNSLATSTSVILISLLTLGYWSYYKSKKLKWYALALLCYFLSVELFRIRTHYLISIVISFELIFFAFRKFPKSVLSSLVRLIPFLYVFYNYFILNADARSTEVKSFVIGLLHGQFYLIFGWISSITHLVLPDWLTTIFNKHFQLSYFLIFLSLLLLIAFALKRYKLRLISLTMFLVLALWYFISKHIFNVPVLNIGAREIFIAFLGGVILLVFLVILISLKKDTQRLFLFFGLWVLVNIAAYSAYSPTVAYESIQRYLMHSFFAITGLFAVLFFYLYKRNDTLSKVVLMLIILWGGGNLINSAIYQRQIVLNRSNVEKKFYTQLKNYLPQIKKGDLLYFDVADNARGNFADSFSVASMPEETAIAWQYGIDRYDIVRFTDYNEFLKYVKDNNAPLGNVYSFFYSNENLTNTTNLVRSSLEKGQEFKEIKFSQKDNEVTFSEPIDSTTPTQLDLQISANIISPGELTFPYVKSAVLAQNSVSTNELKRNLAFTYQKFKSNFITSAKEIATSEWREDVAKNILDNNINTVWRPDRISWHTGKESVTLDLRNQLEIDKFVWINAYENNSPVEYALSVSTDGINWKEVNHTALVKRIPSDIPQIISFDSQSVRFVKFSLIKSLNDDSPGISEIWVTPSKFSELDVNDTEKFLKDPMGYVTNANSYVNTLKNLNYAGKTQIYWLSDKNDSWSTDSSTLINVQYNNNLLNYKVTLPAGGLELKSIRLEPLEIPGTFTIRRISIDRSKIIDTKI